jgi:hypothetical protein
MPPQAASASPWWRWSSSGLYNADRSSAARLPTPASVASVISVLPPPAATEATQRELHAFNQRRLHPGLPPEDWRAELEEELRLRAVEIAFVERERAAVSRVAASAPAEPDAFIAWFERLRQQGPGQDDPLFPWLAREASREQMRWFLSQELAGEAGFDDLVALAQVKMPRTAKLELARNYWDEMGRGAAHAMHGPLLERVARALDLPLAEPPTWEALALSNLMIALAATRGYAYHALGALGVVELTAPGRVALVVEGLERLGVPAHARRYYEVHAAIDPLHSRSWNREVLRTVIEDRPDVARAVAEGALMRLAAGARCFARYRAVLGVV